MGGRKKMGESFPQLGVKPCRLPGSQLPTGVDVVGRVMMLRLQKTEEKLWISVAYPGASPLNFERGGGVGSRLGGRIQVSQNHLPPNSDFSSDFGNFSLEIFETLKVLTNLQNFFLKSRYFGGHPPEFRTGGRVPHPTRWRRPCAYPLGWHHRSGR